MDQLSPAIVIIIIATLFLTLIAIGIVALVLIYQKRQVEERLQTQEHTLNLVSQEIHDNILSELALAKLNLHRIDTNATDDAGRNVSDTALCLSKAIDYLRDLSRSLNTDHIEQIGLVNAIQQKLQLVERSGHCHTSFMVTGDAYPLHPQNELETYRVVQELLSNTIKHADADTICVSVDYRTDKLVINVQDNGKGFDVAAQRSSKTGGLGLKNINTRIMMIHGAISFESTPQKGTNATIELNRKLNRG